MTKKVGQRGFNGNVLGGYRYPTPGCVQRGFNGNVLSSSINTSATQHGTVSIRISEHYLELLLVVVEESQTQRGKTWVDSMEGGEG